MKVKERVQVIWRGMESENTGRAISIGGKVRRKMRIKYVGKQKKIHAKGRGRRV